MFRSGRSIMIREIKLKDKEQWEKLYRGYADFYKVEMNDKILQTVWNWLHDKNHEVKCLVLSMDLAFFYNVQDQLYFHQLHRQDH